MIITAENVKEFYNNLFFDESGEPKGAEVSFIIQSGDQSLRIPPMRVFYDNRLEQIFKTFYNFLEEQGSLKIVEEKEAQEQTENLLKNEALPVRFEEVICRNVQYMVEQYHDGKYIVRRKDDRKIIEEKSPRYNEALKKYKEEYG